MPSARRDLRLGSVSSAALTFASPLSASASLGLPHEFERRPFGRTERKVASLGFGRAEIADERMGQNAVAALWNGALDAAECFVDSEIAIGKAIGARRKEIAKPEWIGPT